MANLHQSDLYLFYNQGLFFAGNKHAAIKVVASYTEDQIITSDPRQLLEIEESKKEFEESQEGTNEAEVPVEAQAEELKTPEQPATQAAAQQ